MIPEAPSRPAIAGAVAAGLVPGPITAAGTSSNNCCAAGARCGAPKQFPLSAGDSTHKCFSCGGLIHCALFCGASVERLEDEDKFFEKALFSPAAQSKLDTVSHNVLTICHMCIDRLKKTSQPAQTSESEPDERHAPALPLGPDDTNGEAPDETDGETIDLSTDDPPGPVFEALIAEQERAWEVVTISKYRGQSNVYDHVHQIKINYNKVSIMLSLFSIHHNNYANNSYHSV